MAIEQSRTGSEFDRLPGSQIFTIKQVQFTVPTRMMSDVLSSLIASYHQTTAVYNDVLPLVEAHIAKLYARQRYSHMETPLHGLIEMQNDGEMTHITIQNNNTEADVLLEQAKASFQAIPLPPDEDIHSTVTDTPHMRASYWAIQFGLMPTLVHVTFSHAKAEYVLEQLLQNGSLNEIEYTVDPQRQTVTLILAHPLPLYRKSAPEHIPTLWDYQDQIQEITQGEEDLASFRSDFN